MAAHVLRFYDSAAHNLATFPVYTENFDPVSALITADTLQALLAGGGDLEHDLPSVEQPWSGLLLADPGGAPATTVTDQLHGLQNALLQAALRRAHKAGPRLFMELQVDGTGDFYRAAIYGGEVQLAPGSLRTPWLAKKVGVRGSFARSIWWEGALTAAALTNRHGTATTGLQIDNAHEAGAYDYHAAIASDAIAGVLPSPLYLRLENTTNVAAATYNLYAGELVLHTGSTFPAGVLEGEAGAGAASVGAASCCNNAYGVVAVPAADGRITYWSLTAGDYLLTDRVRHYLIIGRFYTGALDPTGTVVHCHVAFPTGATTTTIVQTDPVTLTNATRQVLGVLRIPPWLTGDSGTLADMQLELWGYIAGGANMHLDCLDLVALDHWRILRPGVAGRGLEFGEFVHDDAGESLLYQAAAGVGGAHAGLYAVQGPGLYAWPGKAHRLLVLADDESGGSAVDRTHTLTAWYRPRRWTL